MKRGTYLLRRALAAPLLIGAALLPTQAAAIDLDSDGQSDLAVYRPSFGEHYIISSELSMGLAFQWGLTGDTPVLGEYTTNHNQDLVVWRPADVSATGVWYVRYDPTSNYAYGSASAFAWGLPGDNPQPCDVDGDGYNDLNVWRPSNGTWYTRLSDGNGANEMGVYATSQLRQWGLSGDTPIAADYDNDGECDYAIFREDSSTGQGTWYIVLSGTPNTAVVIPFGLQGDTPVPGDYDGDGQIDIAVFRPHPAGAMWLIRPSSISQGNLANWITVYSWGLVGDVPVPMDYDGDGTTDLVVYRRNDVTSPGFPVWYIRTSTGGFTGALAQQWGLTGDIPSGDRRGLDPS